MGHKGGIQGTMGVQSSSQGITGAQGPQGITGYKGPQGPTGIRGSQGPTGVMGYKGGIQGAVGAQSSSQGITGAQGPQGITGYKGGAQGPTGVMGYKGGIQGTMGAQSSSQGITGAQGPQGITGYKGPQGITGVKGSQGPTGTRGSQGITGSIGAQGLSAAEWFGVNGHTGDQGYPGGIGAQGAQGITGIPGGKGTLVLSDDYGPSTELNAALNPLPGDEYEEAFSKIHKAIIDNEEVVAAALNELNSRIADTQEGIDNGKFVIDEGTETTSIIKGYGTEDTVLAAHGVTGQGAVNVNPIGVAIISNWNGNSDGEQTGNNNIYLKTSNGKAYYNGNEIATIDKFPVTSVNGQTGAVSITIPTLSKGTATGTGNAVTDIVVNNHEIKLVKGTSFLTSAPVTSVNGQTGAVITTLAAGYTASSDTNEDLEPAVGDTYQEAISKLHKAILENEEVAAGAIADLDERIDDLADVAFTGDYDDLINKPFIPTDLSELNNDSDFIETTDLKTVGGQSIVGSGNIPVVSSFNGSTGVITFTEATLSKGTATGTGNAVTDIVVNNHQIKLVKGTSFVTSESFNDTEKVVAAALNDLNSRITNMPTLSKGTATGSGNAVTDIVVNNHEIKLVKSATYLTSGTQTQLSKGTATGTGNAVTDIAVNNHKITLIKGTTFLTSAPVTSVNGQTGAVSITIPTLSKGTATGTGNAVTDITVNNHEIKLVKGTTFLTSAPVTSVNGQTGTVTITIPTLSKATATGTGNAVSDINVSNHQVQLVKGASFLTSAPVTSVNGQTGAVTITNYWANIQTSTSENYIGEPEIKSVKINGSTSNAASTNNCQILYDTTNKCLKFVFNS